MLKVQKMIKEIIILAMVLHIMTSPAYAIDTILRAALDPNLPPYQFIGDSGEFEGIHIDILNSIAARYSYDIDYVAVDSETQAIDYLNGNKADVILGAKLIAEDTDNVSYTDSISQSYMCIIASKEKSDDIRQRLISNSFSAALENNTVNYSLVQSLGNLKYEVTSNQVKAFDLLISGDVDLLIGVKHSILYQLEKIKREDDFTIINNYIVPIEYGIGVKSGDKDLYDNLNKGIHQLRVSGEYERIHDKWINESKYFIREFVTKIFYVAFIVVLIAAIIFMFNFRLNRLLKNQVDEKTRELRRINKNLEYQIVKTRNYNELKNCIVENSPSGIIVFDKDYTITLFNHNAARLTNISMPPIGKKLYDIGLCAELLGDSIKEVFAEGYKLINQEKCVINNKETVYYRYDVYQLFNSDSNVRGAILNIEDVTRESIIKSEMFEKEKNRALNQIIAGIAHEIRNPLMSIKTFVELIPVKRDNAKFQDNLAEFVPKEVDRVNNLIKNLIDYAKPSRSNREWMLIEDLVKSCSVLISPMMSNKHVELNVDIEPGLMLMVDKNQLKQVMINIMLNGFESMQEKEQLIADDGGSLRLNVEAWSDDEAVFVQVVDEGVGMTEDEISQATELFFTTKESGTGIGLALSKQYVEENGGIMMIESQKNSYTKITLKFRR